MTGVRVERFAEVGTREFAQLQADSCDAAFVEQKGALAGIESFGGQ